MIEILQHSWQAVLSDELQKPYFEELLVKVNEEYATTVCYPPKELLFEIGRAHV